MFREHDCWWITRTRGRRKLICFMLVVLFCTAIVRKLLEFHQPSNSNLHNFMRDWCRVRRARVDWEQILKPCQDKLKWGSNNLELGLQTDPGSSYISLWDIRPAGEFSKFSIQSTSIKGVLKTIGGDSWRVNINGPSSVAGTLFDHSNGTYEVLFLVTVPGVYGVDVVLEHTLCDGYTDPPPNWFKTGNSQGKNQRQGTLGSVKHHSFLLKKLWGGNPITITVPPSNDGPVFSEVIFSIFSAIMNRYADQFDITCGLRCNYLWDGFGNWVTTGNTLLWKPFVPTDDKPRNLHWFEERVRKTSVLWVYGDSVSEQFYSGIRQHPLCSRVFRWCGHTYNWVYRLQGNLSEAKSQNDDLDFDDVRVLSELEEVIRHPIFDQNSAMLINAGLHYLESSNFTNYQKVVNGIIRLFERKNVQAPLWKDMKVFPGQVIWKTTTSLHKEKLD
ncbi:hypothetical protein QZH41_020709, partial [Actinostola sp. cb2023]